MAVLFGRKFGDHEMYFAAGEARAHLTHLAATGRLQTSSDDEGVDIYQIPRPVKTAVFWDGFMIRSFPFLFVILWSSAFITSKIIVQDASPFASLAFRFAIVTAGFFCFAVLLKESLLASRKDMLEAAGTGILFHGLYLGGVFFAISKGMPAGLSALIVSLQPVLTGALAGPVLGEQVTWRQWVGIALGLAGQLLFWALMWAVSCR